jgi:excisionase family DNA binding protein
MSRFTVDKGDMRTPMDVSTLLALIEKTIAQAKVEDVPAFLGELERLKAILWSRMVAVSWKSTSNHSPDATMLLTMPEVAKRLAIPEGRAYELARQGRLPAVRVGKYVRVPLAKLEAWIGQQTSLERPIDREPYAFHSAPGRNRPVSGSRRNKKHDRASPKAQPKTSVGFRPPVLIPSVAEPGALETETIRKEGQGIRWPVLESGVDSGL